MKWKYLLLPAVAVCASAVAMAQTQYDGTWNLNTSKSQLAGEIMRFEDAGSGMLKFTNADNTYTFKPDGSSFVTPMGSERTIKKIDDNTYEATTKRNGTLLATSNWKLSEDGKTLTMNAKGTKPNGDAFENTTSFMRTTEGKGIVGSWKSNEVKLSSPNSLTFQSDGKDGVVVTIAAEKMTCNLSWDGKDHACSGPTLPDGMTMALTKTGPRSFKAVEKIKNKTVDISEYTLSADGKSMVNKGTDGEGKEPYTEVWDKQS